MRIVTFLLALTTAVQAANVALTPCLYGRVVGGYSVPLAGATTGVPTTNLDGTCHYGNAQGELPSWYAAGYLAAPDDETYNGFPWTSVATDITTTGVGKSCGECFQLFGDAGTIVVMAADVCDKGCCNNCQGSKGGLKGGPDIPNFDVNSAVYSMLTSSNGGGAPIAYRKVSCDMTGGTGVGVMYGMANEGTMQPTYFRMRVFGATVGIQSVEVKGDPSKGTKGQWTPLKRFWEGGWNWTDSGDIGAPYQVRITSILGETLTYNGTIPDFVSNKIYRFNQQFTLPAVDSDLDCGCNFPGPDPNIYIDALGGDNFTSWVDWGSYTTTAPSYATTSGCMSGKCISVLPTAAFKAIQIGYSSGVGAPSTYYTSFSFAVRSPGTATFDVWWNKPDGTTSSKVRISATSSWVTHELNVTQFWPANNGIMHRVQFQFVANTTATCYFDNLKLNDVTLAIPNRVVSPNLAGPPAVGFEGYHGPDNCCTSPDFPCGPNSASSLAALPLLSTVLASLAVVFAKKL